MEAMQRMQYLKLESSLSHVS